MVQLGQRADSAIREQSITKPTKHHKATIEFGLIDRKSMLPEREIIVSRSCIKVETWQENFETEQFEVSLQIRLNSII